jgi:hypothetical protein
MLRMALLAVAATVGTVGSAAAEPVTYRCSPADSAVEGEMSAADLALIDTSAPSLELQVAASMATDTPLNWMFTNRPDEGLGPDRLVLDVVFEAVVGGGFRGSTAYSFILDGGDFLLTTTSIYGVQTYRWTCAA